MSLAAIESGDGAVVVTAVSATGGLACTYRYMNFCASQLHFRSTQHIVPAVRCAPRHHADRAVPLEAVHAAPAASSSSLLWLDEVDEAALRCCWLAHYWVGVASVAQVMVSCAALLLAG